jgi:hypothetical protein
MSRTLSLSLALAAALASMGASYRVQSTNFLVEAPTPQIAQQVAQYAEHYRREKAKEWLGREMPAWRSPCPLRVVVTMDGAGGATTFTYGNGEVHDQQMQIEGSLDRLLASVLPHEVTHTVFAHYYRCPVPRWADEGGSVLSEDEVERSRHDQLAWQILRTPGRAIPLRRLFALREYPGDVMPLYAQGYSVTNFLVQNGGRQTFLNFVAHGMRHGWDGAVQTHYRYRSVEELEKAWIDHMKETRRAPAQLARNTGPAEADPARRVVVRQTAPPAPPVLEAPTPIVRGQSPAAGDDSSSWSRPVYLPDYPARGGSPLAPRARPTVVSDPPGPVTLGAPQFIAPPPAQPGQPAPVGHPR